MFNRLQDVSTIDRSQIEAILAKGDRPIIQFSVPGYSSDLLRQIDVACAEFGPRLEVRFYSHHRTGFDASCLALLPNAASLSVDCLGAAKNVDALFGLPRLQRLSLGIFDLDRPDILARLTVDSLEELFLCETRKADIDLSSLVRCRSLHRLHISGHTRGFDTLAALHSVSELSLRSIPKKQSLAAVNDMSGLRALTIVLGGRANIDDIKHPELTGLDVVWVRGLETIGSLARFHKLQRLRVEDQLQLRSVELATAPTSLSHLTIFNCKNLQSLGSIADLSGLIDLRIGRTSLDFEALLRSGLPRSLQSVALYSGRKKADDIMRSRLDALGYVEFTRPTDRPDKPLPI